jgi:anti-anti-sigma factor
MKARLAIHGDKAVYALSGDFEFFVRDEFLAEIKDRVERGLAHIILNLSRVTFLSSTGIGALIAAEKLLTAAGGRLVLSQPSEAVNSSLTLVGLNERLNVCADDTAALALCF